VGIGDYAGALPLAEKALGYSPTEETQILVRDLRSREGTRLFQEGAAAVAGERWADAVEKLESAQKLAPTDEGARLLATARTVREKEARRAFDALTAEAGAALHAREWEKAATKFKAANELLADPDAHKCAAFARCMAEAEAMYGEQPTSLFGCQRLVSKYEEALRFGIDQDFVRQRMNSVPPANYRVTINSAVVLPFKPGSKMPWDGFGGAVADADKLLKSLGGLAELSQGQASLVGEVTKLAIAGTAAPDCYIIARVGDLVWHNRDQRDENDLHPTWNFPLTFPQRNAFDRTILRLEVRDRDLEEDDNVGEFQVSVGELIQKPGERTFQLFNPQGVLSAGALLSITITTERL